MTARPSSTVNGTACHLAIQDQCSRGHTNPPVIWSRRHCVCDQTLSHNVLEWSNCMAGLLLSSAPVEQHGLFMQAGMSGLCIFRKACPSCLHILDVPSHFYKRKNGCHGAIASIRAAVCTSSSCYHRESKAVASMTVRVINNACRDLHQNIGRGEIGPGCFERLMADPRLDGLPLIMETPAQSEGPPIDFVQSLQQVRFGSTYAA